jgi:S1-C subfamily serine protease
MLWRIVAVVLVWAGLAQAQDRVWVQIEALPTRDEALAQAEAWAAAFADVQGYDAPGGWHVIVLGPHDPATGAARLDDLRRENLIPGDSFIVDGSRFGAAFWPATGVSVPEVTATPLPDPVPEVAAPPLPDPAPAAPEETEREARAGEALLDAPAREALQQALAWYGFYQGGIDGAFGRGTRAAMAAWQEATGAVPTGILTTRQRDTLVANWQADITAFGFAEVLETEAGIRATLPMGLVAFDGYEPPFVRYVATDGSDLRLYLISQPGDPQALAGLYDLMQTLDVIPPAGDRQLRERSFTLTGANATVAARAEVDLAQGLIKGWLLVWSPADADRAGRIAATLDRSFAAVGTTALDPGMVPMEASVQAGLLGGLDLRAPRLSRSGFFVSPDGVVVTTVAAVTACGRVTIERDIDAEVVLADAESGIAVLRPVTPVAPPAVAALQTAPDRVGTGVAVAGYPYEDALPAPVMTFGTVAALTGLDGEAGVKRLDLAARAGDAGGPVVDGTGAVLGMLLPAPAGGAALPPGVAFARTSDRVAALLAQAGVTATTAARSGALPPEDLATGTLAITTIVGCWDA